MDGNEVDKIILTSNPILLLHDLTLQNINKHVYKRDTPLDLCDACAERAYSDFRHMSSNRPSNGFASQPDTVHNEIETYTIIC